MGGDKSAPVRASALRGALSRPERKNEMNVTEMFNIVEMFGLFAVDSTFTPFFGWTVVVCAVLCIAKIIRGRAI